MALRSPFHHAQRRFQGEQCRDVKEASEDLASQEGGSSKDRAERDQATDHRVAQPYRSSTWIVDRTTRLRCRYSNDATRSLHQQVGESVTFRQFSIRFCIRVGEEKSRVLERFVENSRSLQIFLEGFGEFQTKDQIFSRKALENPWKCKILQKWDQSVNNVGTCK